MLMSEVLKLFLVAKKSLFDVLSRKFIPRLKNFSEVSARFGKQLQISVCRRWGDCEFSVFIGIWQRRELSDDTNLIFDV